MTRRNDVNPIFRDLPKPILFAIVVLVGFPLHLIAGLFLGLLEGFENFKASLSAVYNLDKKD